MQAIQTKYVGATNEHGSRIRAKCARGSLAIPYPHDTENGITGAHEYAAQQLVNKFLAEDVKEYGTPAKKNSWNRRRICGQLADGSYVHVFNPS